MSIIEHPLTVAFGLYKLDCDELRGGKCFDLNLSKITLGNILSWISAIGVIIGVVHIVAGTRHYIKKSKEQDPPDQGELDFAKGMIARGVAEVLGMGSLLMVVDIALSALRCCPLCRPTAPHR